jgi:hypothetical protein
MDGGEEDISSADEDDDEEDISSADEDGRGEKRETKD